MSDDEAKFLPHAEEAVIPDAKLRDYVLNGDHPDGRHKARVFRSALGLGADDWQYLRDQILEQVRSCPVTKERPRPPSAVEYEVVMSIDGLNGKSHPVVTAWFVLEGSPPRLSTAYVDLRRRRR